MPKKQQRRTKGTGTVFQRSEDKLWVGGVELPKNKKTGKRQQRRVYAKTQAGALAKIASARRRAR